MGNDLTNRYVHGFSAQEQERLLQQAKLTEQEVYKGIDLSDVSDLLEVGCGVGAQTSILLRRYPKLNITAIDLSDLQLKVAVERLKKDISVGSVSFHQMNAEDLSGIKKTFDAAFSCWFLEHVPEPANVLKEIKTKLKVGGKLYLTEVNNSTFFMDPYSPNTLKYWFELNDLQWSKKGHPFIGVQLGNLLADAGFSEIKIEPRPMLYDNRYPLRKKVFAEEFLNFFLSSQDMLLKEKRVDQTLIDGMKKEFEMLRDHENGVFYWEFVHARACNG